MLNLKKIFQVDKSQVATSKLEKLHQSQSWEKLSETEIENIQGSWGAPPPPTFPINNPWDPDI